MTVFYVWFSGYFCFSLFINYYCFFIVIPSIFVSDVIRWYCFSLFIVIPSEARNLNHITLWDSSIASLCKHNSEWQVVFEILRKSVYEGKAQNDGYSPSLRVALRMTGGLWDSSTTKQVKKNSSNEWQPTQKHSEWQIFNLPYIVEEKICTVKQVVGFGLKFYYKR